MKKYEPVLLRENLKKIESKNNLININMSNIIVQNPFSIYELNEKFDLGTKIEFSYSSEETLKKWSQIENLAKDINSEFNDIRQILYNFTLIKIAELQKKISELL